MKNMGITQQWWWNHEHGRSCDIRAWRRIYPRIHDDMAIIECSIWSTINVLQSPPQKYPRVQLSIHEHWDWTSTKSYWDRSDFTDTHAHTHQGTKTHALLGGFNWLMQWNLVGSTCWSKIFVFPNQVTVVRVSRFPQHRRHWMVHIFTTLPNFDRCFDHFGWLSFQTCAGCSYRSYDL